jgi:hypothetical protein
MRIATSMESIVLDRLKSFLRSIGCSCNIKETTVESEQVKGLTANATKKFQLGKKNCFGALSFQKLFLICVY